MIRKKAEVLPRHYIIGIIAFTFIIMGGVGILNIYKNAGAAFIDTEEFTRFNETFNKMDDVTTVVGDMESNIVNDEGDYGLLGVLNSLISTGWNTLKLLFSSLSFMDGVFKGLSSFFGVPTWVGGLIILFVSTILVFAIFSAVFQREI